MPNSFKLNPKEAVIAFKMVKPNLVFQKMWDYDDERYLIYAYDKTDEADKKSDPYYFFYKSKSYVERMVPTEDIDKFGEVVDKEPLVSI